jgi:hypothetical protein
MGQANANHSQLEPSTSRWFTSIISLLVVGLLMTACNPATKTVIKEQPATVEKIAGSDLSRIVLTEKAARRLGLETTLVRNEQLVHMRRVGGEVMAVRAASNKPGTSGASVVRVRVALNRNDLGKVNRVQQARVVGMDHDESDLGDSADLDEVSTNTVGSDDEDEPNLQYTVKGGKAKMVAGQRVFVELPLSGKVQRSVVPYEAVIYDLQGETWVYTNPAPLTYVRHQVKVDYIDGENAVLAQAPPMGTKVVSVGVAELFGTEFGIGK